MNLSKNSAAVLLRTVSRMCSLIQKRGVTESGRIIHTSRGGEGFVVELASHRDHNKIVDFVSDIFMKEEPISRAIGMTRDDAYTLIPEMVRHSLKHDLSCVVAEEQTGRMAAVRLLSVATRGEKDDHGTKLSEKARIIANYLEYSWKDLWDFVDPGVHRVIRREITSVRRKHMRKGIAQFLVDYLIDPTNISRLDVQGIASQASSLANQKLLQNNGYVILKEYMHSDYLDSNGRQIFVCDDGTDRIVLFYRDLRDNQGTAN